MNKKEKVIKWLKDHNVFEQFCNNSPKREIPADILLIHIAFRWKETPEKEKFWSNIAKEYIQWYKNEFMDDAYNEKKEVDESVYVNFKEINN